MSERTGARHLGIFGATGVGVGAIVGGGILALSGAAFEATGPSAIVAFALNGLIAVLTALSFAEVASKFPQSGGTYTFAKKVLPVESAFTVGWVVWFASIVAAVLYALGFAEFAAAAYEEGWRVMVGSTPPIPVDRSLIVVLAIGATGCYTVLLTRSAGGGGQWANIGKVTVFGILILAGLFALRDRSADHVASSLSPFFEQGPGGLFRAMGFTFIALQGFDLIAAVGGEVREPQRVIPRAMLLSLAIALVIYLPLLFVVATVGTPAGSTVAEFSRSNPETVIARAAESYLGSFGYWLVMVGAILSMLSALQANLFAASRVALSMARDRTLPSPLARLSSRSQLPVLATLATAVIVVVTLLVLPDVAAAGAASSLIFLITFALAHGIAILVRRRSVSPPPFRVPLYPVAPLLGGSACLGLALYQGLAVPAAGSITLFWLSLGLLLFLSLLAPRARVADASIAALNPEVVQLRGRSPLVLVPIAKPDTAPSLVAVAHALVTPRVGRVLLLSVVVAEREWRPSRDRRPLQRAQLVLESAISASVEEGLFPEALATVATQPWDEISRVARLHRCESLLVGLSDLTATATETPLDRLMSTADCDIVVLRAPKGWTLSGVERVLVPMGGRGGHDRLLARLLGSVARRQAREITLFRVLPITATSAAERQASRDLKIVSLDLCGDAGTVKIVRHEQPLVAVAEEATRHDLMILGVQRLSRRRKLFGQFALEVARQTECPLLLISRRG